MDDAIKHKQGSTMEMAIVELEALKERYDQPDFQDCLHRLTAAQASQNVEEWAATVYARLRDENNETSISLNRDRKTILQLVYELVDVWNGVRDDLGNEAADKFEEAMVDNFKIRRLERILGFGVPMDRAQALLAMKIPTFSKYGMHWYSKYHFDSDSPYCNYDYEHEHPDVVHEWDDLLRDYPGRPTMNKRMFQLLFSKKFGLQERFPSTFGRWSNPQPASFVVIGTNP